MGSSFPLSYPSHVGRGSPRRSPGRSIHLRALDLARRGDRTAVAGAAPIGGVMAALDEPREARPRPGVRARRRAVLHRIVVNVLDAPDQVVFVADEVLPEPHLPHAALFVTLARRALGGFDPAGVEVGAGEAGLDGGDALGEIGIGHGKLNHQVQVVRQQHAGDEIERAFVSRPRDRDAEEDAGILLIEQPRPAMGTSRRVAPRGESWA